MIAKSKSDDWLDYANSVGKPARSLEKFFPDFLVVSPAKTGQSPAFEHSDANGSNSSGGSSSDANSPPGARRIAWVETRDRRRAASRAGHAAESV